MKDKRFKLAQLIRKYSYEAAWRYEQGYTRSKQYERTVERFIDLLYRPSKLFILYRGTSDQYGTSEVYGVFSDKAEAERYKEICTQVPCYIKEIEGNTLIRR